MDRGFDLDVFKGSYRYSMLQTFRYMNAGSFVGLQVLGLVLFSWWVA